MTVPTGWSASWSLAVALGWADAVDVSTAIALPKLRIYADRTNSSLNW